MTLITVAVVSFVFGFSVIVAYFAGKRRGFREGEYHGLSCGLSMGRMQQYVEQINKKREENETNTGRT